MSHVRAWTTSPSGDRRADPTFERGGVVDLAGHGVDVARECLDRFERMGTVTRVTNSPATYERNQACLNWRRVRQLRQGCATEELLDLPETESERVATLGREFGGEPPDEISISRHASETGRPIEDVWDRLSAWRTARRRVALLERALATESGDGAELQSAV